MPTVVRRAKAKAKARVERAAQVKRSNERRDARFAAVKKLAAPQQALGRLDEMKTWSAKTVTGFLEQADLVGPAKLLFQSGVNGADLIEFRIQELVDDLRLSAFAARKVLKARDDFLSSA